MIVRCGRCGGQFDVSGPGRYACPACGTANQVTAGGAPGMDVPPGAMTPPPPPAETGPPPGRVECPECGHAFFVGPVAVAPCPNCRTPIETGIEPEPDQPDDEEE